MYAITGTVDGARDDGFLGSEEVGRLCKRDRKGQACFTPKVPLGALKATPYDTQSPF